MPKSWRFFRPLLLIAILVTVAFPLTTAQTFAQDGGTIVIQGDQELAPMLEAIRDAYVSTNEDAEIEITPQGPNIGFNALCEGNADIVMSTEPITDTQIKTCADKGVTFVEVVLAYDAIAVVAPPAAAGMCLDETTVNGAWQLGGAPAAADGTGGVPVDVTWEDLGVEALSGPVSFVGLPDFSTAYIVLQRLLPAGDLREGIEFVEAPAAVVEQVTSEDSVSMGYMSLFDYENLDENDATLVGVQTSDGCITPSQETVEAGSYPLSRAVYLYVGAESAAQSEVQDFMTFALTDENGAPAVAAAQGHTVPSEAVYQRGLDNVIDVNAGRTFTRAATPVEVSTIEAGTINVVGSAFLNALTKGVATDFSNTYVSADVNISSFGDTAGWQAFCSGEADVLEATRPATDEEMALCDENGITPREIALGNEALVVAVPEDAEWITCLNAEDAAAILGAATEETPAVATWSEVNSDWMDESILVVSPPRQSGELDYLAYTLMGKIDFLQRDDGVENADPLYRAQGVANTTNGLTYLWWSDLPEAKVAIKLLEVDAGDDCVAPSVETIADGTYPLSFPVRYYFSDASLDQPLVRAFLWQFYTDDTLDRLESTPYAGLDLDVMAGEARDEMFTFLAEYTVADAEPDTEADVGTEPEMDTEAETGAEPETATEDAPASTD